MKLAVIALIAYLIACAVGYVLGAFHTWLGCIIWDAVFTPLAVWITVVRVNK